MHRFLTARARSEDSLRQDSYRGGTIQRWRFATKWESRRESLYLGRIEGLNMSESEYDLVAIGSGPAGQKGAIAAAKARKRVAIIDQAVMIGGVSVHTGTIPSKTIREAIFQLTGFAVKALYGNGSGSRVDISVEDVSSRVSAIVQR